MPGLTLDEITLLTGDKLGTLDLPCPRCSPFRKACNQHRKTLRIWRHAVDFATYRCAHCEIEGHTFDRNVRCDPVKLEQRRAQAAKTHAEAVAVSHAKANWLWRQSAPIKRTVAERYLREARGYRGPIPPTLRFLPARDSFPPAMIAAFGSVREDRIGDDGASLLEIDGRMVRGVHLTKLRLDGSGKADVETAKITVGKDVVAPIWLAPVTDSLGLSTAEGIEDGLSVFATLGTGTWAAGSAPRLPGLANHVADYIEAVTILEDDDEAGRRNTAELAESLMQRRIEVRRVNLARLLARAS